MNDDTYISYNKRLDALEYALNNYNVADCEGDTRKDGSSSIAPCKQNSEILGTVTVFGVGMR